MTAVVIPNMAPPVAPGAKVTEALKHGLYVMKGPDITYDVTGTVELFRVPANTFVHEVVVNVTGAWDATGTPTILIGDSDDTDRFMTAAVSVVKTAGSKSSKSLAVAAGGHIYTDDALITCTNTDGSGGGSSSGVAETYLVFSNHADLL